MNFHIYQNHQIYCDSQYSFSLFFPPQDFDGNISKKCFKGLVGLRVNLTDPEKAQKLKEDTERKTKKGNLKKTPEVLR